MKPQKQSYKNTFFLLIGPFLFFLMLAMEPPEGMPPAAWATLAATIWIAIYWVSEILPIAITSLLPLLLFPLTGALSMPQVTETYSRSLTFLFLGGFILALAMERWNLHRRIALTIISWAGTNERQIVLGFVAATGFLSMWISNTATTMMMLPIGLSIVTQFNSLVKKDPSRADDFGKALVLSIAYAASIGGMATLIGTPTNLIFSDSIQELFGIDFGFSRWMQAALPISVLLLVICWWHLTHIAFKLSKLQVEGSESIIQAQLRSLGKMSAEEKWVLGIFSTVALSWILRTYLISPWLPAVNDMHIALIGATLLFVIPAPSMQGEKLMDWPTALKLPWGVLLLFGGAFAVAAAFDKSGLTVWIGRHLTLLNRLTLWFILLIIVTGVNFLTEITMNMATCTLMMPLLAALAPAIDAHPFALMAATCIASSCAFMLPVATAPNAIVFGSNYLKIKDMARAGLLLNVFSIIIIVLYTWFLLPLIWGIEIGVFPASLGK